MITLPPRVQRKRTKGYRLRDEHPGALVVSRPTKYGNPFEVEDAIDDDPTLTDEAARAKCARTFRLWLDGDLEVTGPELVAQRAWILGHLERLAGHPLACYCPIPDPGEADHCHAVHLIELANTGDNVLEEI